jgi:signal transduction histidine kinase
VNGAKGTGLGLFIVKSVIEKHGGRLRAESRGEGRGSTFFIQLPRA